MCTNIIVHNKYEGCCFGGAGNVLMYNNTYKKVQDIIKGDILAFGAKVICVTSFANVNTINYFEGNNILEITPWHPILRNGNWVYPNDHVSQLQKNSTMQKNTVYNFVLDAVHLVNINNIIACTFGHTIKGPVIGHEFYGTEEVINDLKKMCGWSRGYINISSEIQIADNKGNIIGYVDGSINSCCNVVT